MSEARPKYQLLLELGVGGMATAHLAMSRGPQGFVKLFVLKMLKRALLADAEARDMFLEEARLCARLTHPNIVQVYEVIEFDGIPTIVMEYLEGQALSSILRDSPARLPLDLHLHVISKLLAGLHAAHELTAFDGTPLHPVHRDVSPHNVFVQYDGQVKILDFGIAKANDSRVETQSGVLKGKLRYMAPEQIGGKAQDRRVDIFATGIMLWEALAGARFWDSRPEAEIILTLLNEELPALPKERDIPQVLREICERALQRDPNQRYATAAEFQRDLDAYLALSGEGDAAQRLGAKIAAEFTESRRTTNALIDAAIKAAERASVAPAQERSNPRRLSDAPTRIEPIAAITQTSRLRSPVRLTWLFASVGLVTALGTAVWFGLASADRTTPTLVTSSAPLTCSASEKACGEQCLSRDRPDYGCGNASCAPCLTQNATPRCNSEARCDIALCHKGFDDCDGNAANGCEADIRLDPDNCGACKRRCPELPHAERGCGDVCTIWRCHAGHRDCNGEMQDGCEISVANDSKNCGHCGVKCAPGQRCREGRCG
ncbi:MAG: protein kinase domain-containing protein [Myxococcota bacterium]